MEEAMMSTSTPRSADAYEMALPWVESPFFEALLAQRRLSNDDERLARQYHDEGFVVLDGIASPELSERIVRETQSLFTDAADGARSRYRVQGAWRESSAVKTLASHPRVLSVLEMLYGRAPFPFQTL